MKIRLAIIDNNQAYLNRISAALSAKYSDKIEIYSFSDDKAASAALGSADVVLAHEEYDIDVNPIPKRCAFARLIDRQGVDRVNGCSAVCRFQRVDVIYKQILNLYSEVAANLSGTRSGSSRQTHFFVFSSPCGGVGTSTVAAACARHFASQDKRTLYLNLEKFGEAGLFFSGVGQFNLSDIILALKNRKANLQIKLESCVRQDASGVFFFCEPTLALDRMELSSDEILRLVKELELSNQYDYIIVDIDFSLDTDMKKIYRYADALIWVSDGSLVANRKTERAYECIETINSAERTSGSDMVLLIDNKSSGAEKKLPQGKNLRCVGTLPQYKAADTNQLLAGLASFDIFEKIG